MARPQTDIENQQQHLRRQPTIHEWILVDDERDTDITAGEESCLSGNT
jgi:hypothetical protein